MRGADLTGDIETDVKDREIAALRKEIYELKAFIAELQKRHQEAVQALKDEIARLKGHKTKPQIRPSQLEGKPKNEKSPEEKRPGSEKTAKTAALTIHETVQISPKEGVPPGSDFKGYAEYTVVGLRFEPHNVRYRLEIWETPDGKRLTGELPPSMKLLGGHCSPELVSYVVYQHHQCLVPQAVIGEQLRDIGVPISEGQINRILLDYSGPFHEEKEAMLQVGLQVSRHLHVDDTGARHKGKNGYCTYLGNGFFAYYASTESKSRINFLTLLRAGHTDYVIDADALAYMAGQKLPKAVLSQLKAVGECQFADEAAFRQALGEWGITKRWHVRIVTEGALLASVLRHDIHPELAIISDDAGQFNVLCHGLCWIHAERTLAKLIGFNDAQQTALDTIRTQVWDLYWDLKAYKDSPTDWAKCNLEQRFDTIFSTKTCFASLNHALERLLRNKAELLLVLTRPDLPLHNNPSENDIRHYVTMRKRNGSTRSDLGRRCRDTFASLKKTCRKHGISFWQYLLDRFSGAHTIPPLPDLIRLRAQELQHS